ncbi:MAG: heme ABC exporter ATP-binding protein CcmA [Legionellaceae bacterium]|nr:heme ABC exporter ATP-binding protein CcmA [Legionellaceae bacterium]
MLNVSNLGFGFQDTAILKTINFSVRSGELLHILGENGAGKTTLLRLLAGLLEPQSGEIVWEHRGRAAESAADSGYISMVGHQTGLCSLLSIFENYRSYPGLGCEQLALLLEQAGLADYAYARWLGMLSAGQRKRASLLRLEIEKKPLWLLDEPFVALDTKGIEYLTCLIRNHLQAQGIVILSSHQALPATLHPCLEYAL